MWSPDPEAIALDEATELEGSDGTYSAEVGEEWEVWGPSGGYLAALTLRAAGLCAEIPRPASYYCHFLSPPEFGPVELSVERLKQGRRSESLAVRMTQGGRDIMFAVVRTAAEGPGYSHQEVEAPAVDPPDASRPVERRAADGGRLFAFWNNVSCRRPANGEDRQRALTGDPGVGPVRADADVRGSVHRRRAAADPARHIRLAGGLHEASRSRFVAPNLDTAVWFHRPPAASGWLLVDHESPVAGGGLIGVSGRVWDEERNLVASGGAQLYSIPRP